MAHFPFSVQDEALPSGLPGSFELAGRRDVSPFVPRTPSSRSRVASVTAVVSVLLLAGNDRQAQGVQCHRLRATERVDVIAGFQAKKRSRDRQPGRCRDQ